MVSCTVSGQNLPNYIQYRRRNCIPIFPKTLTPINEFSVRAGLSSKNSDHENRMLVLGMGYVGQFFANQLKNDGWDVSGTCTNIRKKMKLEQKGFNVHLFNTSEPEWSVVDSWRSFTHLLVSVPSNVDVGDPILQYEDILRTRLLDGNLRWLCYLSSTSVYGDCGGSWVDEDYIPNPTTKAAQARLKAEKGWLKLANDLNLTACIVRLGGIYGPGRSAIDTILKQEPLSESQKRRVSKSFTSRVHVADICQALKASISIPISRKIYNVVDDDPASRAEVFAFAHHLIEKKWPGLIHSTEVASRNHLNEEVKPGEKRVSNSNMKRELGVELLHPSYRSGLQDIINRMQSPENYGVPKIMMVINRRSHDWLVHHPSQIPLTSNKAVPTAHRHHLHSGRRPHHSAGAISAGGGGRSSVDTVEYLVQRIKPVAELSHLSSQHRVFSLHVQELLCGDAHGVQDLIILSLQICNLNRQIFLKLLLPHPRPPRRFAVRFHPLPLPLVHHNSLLRFLLGTRVPAELLAGCCTAAGGSRSS
ncbi:hypothetical protein V2J09_019783 [Rumex salicifolius]